MANQQAGLQEEIRLSVSCLMSHRSDLSTRQNMEEVLISNSRVYYPFTALADMGFVKLGNLKNLRGGQYAYVLKPKGIRQKSFLSHCFLKRDKKRIKSVKV